MIKIMYVYNLLRPRQETKKVIPLRRGETDPPVTKTCCVGNLFGLLHLGSQILPDTTTIKIFWHTFGTQTIEFTGYPSSDRRVRSRNRRACWIGRRASFVLGFVWWVLPIIALLAASMMNSAPAMLAGRCTAALLPSSHYQIGAQNMLDGRSIDA